MIETCEAVFINQFNMWVTDATGRSTLMTAEKYVRDDKYTKADISENKAFYEFLILISDNRLDSANRTEDRDRYNQFWAGYEYSYSTPSSQGNALGISNQFSQTSSSSYEIFYNKMAQCAKALNTRYSDFNAIYSSFGKMNNIMNTFKGFIINDSRNLFFYVFNSLNEPNKSPIDEQYFPFMDINIPTDVNKLSNLFSNLTT